MRTSKTILIPLLLACAGCVTGHRAALFPDIQEPEIRQVVERIGQLRPGMSKQQVWMVLGKLPLEDKVIWIQGGSDWGEGTDAYLLKHGYSVSLFWDFTDYANYYSNLNWVTGQPWPWARPERTEGIYKRTWLDHEGRNRIEF